MKRISKAGAMIVCSVLFAFTLVAGSAFGADSEPFYDGETVTIIVATKPGGGYDTYARLLAPRLQKYLPGSTVIVKNVPGAGHIIGANALYKAKPDGLTIGTFNKGLITAQIVDMPGVRFDLAKMTWLGTPAVAPRMFMVSEKAPFKTIEDILKGDKTVILSSAGVGSGAHTDALMIGRILGLDNLKLVTGYNGTEGEMAMMRGEVHGQVGSVDSMIGLYQNGDAHPVLVIGNERLKEFPDTPLIYEYSSEELKPLVDLMVSQALISRPYAGPPGIPADRAKILREAFENAWSDPELLADAIRLGRPIEFKGGEAVAAIVVDALDQPPEVVAILKNSIMKKKKKKKKRK